MKNEGLSYPTHFVEIGDSYIRKNFHELRIKKSTYLRDEMYFIRYSLQK